MKKSPSDKPTGKNKRFLWTLLFLLIAALSVYAVGSQSKGFSPKHFMEYLHNNNPWWLAAAVLAMLAYIGFDAVMVGTLLRGFGYPKSHMKCVSYAAADLYFSAITPSATGGQPMEAFFMTKDGVPGIISTVVMLTYLLLYTLSIVIIGLVCLILFPCSFTAFGTLGRVFIAVGAAIQVGLAVFYALPPERRSPSRRTRARAWCSSSSAGASASRASRSETRPDGRSGSSTAKTCT